MLTIFSYKRGMFVWAKSEDWESEKTWVWVERKRELQWQQPCCHCSSCKSSRCNPPPSCISISNKMDLSRGCRRFCRTTLNIVSVCYPSYWANISTPPVRAWGAGIPNNWYQSIWFKGMFDFCSKIKVVKIVFWPHHCVEEEETKPLLKTASKSDVEIVRTRRRGYCPRVTCVFFARMGWPDPNTCWPDPRARPG
jgi:hypothetical protein